ncbi:MAG: peptide ABC transporter substrate-binding protein [Streptosporangiales bacterium]
MRTVARVVIPAVAIALAAVGCGGGEDQQAGLKAFSASLGEPAELIPGNASESEGNAVDRLLFSALTTVDAKTGEAVNLVAKSVTSSDQKNWTIKIRDGWTFHNGEPVTAQSFAGAWNAVLRNGWYTTERFTGLLRIKGSERVVKHRAKTMSGVKVVDDSTLMVHLEAPNINFPLILGYHGFFPMPESVVKKGDWKSYREKPIGNGPYKMAEPWNHNETVTLEKFGDYTGPDAGKADKITFKIYSDPNTAYNDVTAGNLDVSTNIPDARVASAPQDLAGGFLTHQSSSFTYLGFPLWLDQYSDARARKAISMAIDREAIVHKVLNGTASPAQSLVTPLIKLGHRDDACGELCEYHPAKARQLWKQSGYDSSKPVALWYNTGSGNEGWVEAVAHQLHNILGVKTTLKGQQWTQYLQTTRGHKVTGPYRLGWVEDYPSPVDYLAPLYGTGAASNGTGYSNRAVDKALQKGNEATSPKKSVTYYHRAENLILQDMPVAPLWFADTKLAHTSRVSHFKFDGLGYLEYGQIGVTD